MSNVIFIYLTQGEKLRFKKTLKTDNQKKNPHKKPKTKNHNPMWGWRKKLPLPSPVYKEKTLEGEQEEKRGVKNRNYTLDFKCNFLWDSLLQNQVRWSSWLWYKTNFKEQALNCCWMHAEQSQRSAREGKKQMTSFVIILQHWKVRNYHV